MNQTITNQHMNHTNTQQKMMKTIMIIVIIKINMKSKRNENNYRNNWPALSKSLIWLRTLIKWTSWGSSKLQTILFISFYFRACVFQRFVLILSAKSEVLCKLLFVTWSPYFFVYLTSLGHYIRVAIPSVSTAS